MGLHPPRPPSRKKKDGRKKFRLKKFSVENFSVENFAVRVAEGRSNGGGPAGAGAPLPQYVRPSIREVLAEPRLRRHH